MGDRAQKDGLLTLEIEEFPELSTASPRPPPDWRSGSGRCWELPVTAGSSVTAGGSQPRGPGTQGLVHGRPEAGRGAGVDLGLAGARRTLEVGDPDIAIVPWKGSMEPRGASLGGRQACPWGRLQLELAVPQACNGDQREGKVPAPYLVPGSFPIS